jgi:hypothetical protein
MLKLTTIGLMICAGLLEAQPVLNGPRVQGPLDASGATATRPVRVGAAAPAAPCSRGEIYFSTGAAAGQNLYLCQPDNVWTQQASASYTFRDGMVNASGTVDWTPDASIFTLKDDFPPVSGAGELPWYGYGTHNPVTYQAGHPGINEAKTTTAANNDAGWNFAYNTTYPFSLGASSPFSSWDTRAIIQIDNAAGAGNLSNVGGCFSLMYASRGCIGDAQGYGIIADTAPTFTCTAGDAWSTTNWMYVWRDWAATNCKNSGVAVQSATWYHLRMWSTAPGSNVSFSVNGSAAYTATTNICANAMTPAISVITRTTAAKTMWIDYFNFKGRGLTR